VPSELAKAKYPHRPLSLSRDGGVWCQRNDPELADLRPGHESLKTLKAEALKTLDALDGSQSTYKPRTGHLVTAQAVRRLFPDREEGDKLQRCQPLSRTAMISDRALAKDHVIPSVCDHAARRYRPLAIAPITHTIRGCFFLIKMWKFSKCKERGSTGLQVRRRMLARRRFLLIADRDGVWLAR
jgi:hypothetical protein